MQSKRLAVNSFVVLLATGVAAWLAFSKPFILPDDLPAGMSVAAPQRCVAIFLVCMSLWLTNLIPLAATGLLAIALLPLLGVLGEKEAFSLFGNRALFFMLGVFLLAAAMISTGLSKRITLIALQRFDQSPARLVVGVTLSAAFLALWMPEHAVAAMIYPILVEIVDTLGLKQGHPYAKKLFLGLAWGSIIGGVGTFLGGARVPLALSLLHEAHPEAHIGFLDWLLASAPIVVTLTCLAVWIVLRRIPDDLQDIKAATRMLDQRVRRLGPMSGKEWRLALLGGATILTWIIWGHELGLAVIAMISASLLFLLRVVLWPAVQDYVNWGVLIMYGGAVALGSALSETHAIDWMAQTIIGPQTPRMVVILAMAAVAIFLTEGISNSAAVAILLPIGYSMGDMIGVGPVMITLAVTVPAGLAFLLPISSPPNAISFAAGHYSIREVVRIGWPMTASAVVVVGLVIVIWWDKMLGIGSW